MVYLLFVTGIGKRSSSPRVREAGEVDALTWTRDRALKSLETDFLDVFYVEYVSPDHSADAIDVALETLVEWKRDGTIRYVGASAHDRQIAGDLAETGKVDVLMHRYNMAHRKSETSVLPRAKAADVPVVAFTCTRWGSLLRGHPDWAEKVPTAPDFYRFALAHDAVRIALTAPSTISEHNENVETSVEGGLSESELLDWSRCGDLVYGDGKDAFETRWP